MKLVRLIMGLLIAAAVLVTGYSYIQLSADERSAIQTAEQGVLLERDRVAAHRKALERLGALQQSRADLSARLIGDNPFADMEWVLSTAAAEAQVRLELLSLTGAVGVEGMPGLGQYDAEVEITGTYPQVVAFIRLLETHRLLLQIPDLDLDLEAANTGPFTAQFTLQFYRAMDVPPPSGTSRQ